MLAAASSAQAALWSKGHLRTSHLRPYASPSSSEERRICTGQWPLRSLQTEFYPSVTPFFPVKRISWNTMSPKYKSGGDPKTEITAITWMEPGTRGHHVNWNKRGTKSQVPHDLTHAEFLKAGLIETESRTMASRCWERRGEGRTGRGWPMGTKLQSDRSKKPWSAAHRRLTVDSDNTLHISKSSKKGVWMFSP